MTRSTLERPRDARGVFTTRPLEEWYEVDSISGCWIWLGRLDNKGYGRMKVNNRWGNAHRFIYQQLRGPIPEGLHCDHLCRNRLCVNPDHIEPVTPCENTRRGAKAILNMEKAREIRRRMDEMCAEFGVRPRTLAAIAERRLWREDQ